MSYSENNSFEQIMERMLANPKLANVDKRVGSIVYDAMAPIAMELADAYIKMDTFDEQSYLMTATGRNLEKKVYDYGIKRIESTKSKRIGSFKTYEKDEKGDLIYYTPEGEITTKENGKPKLIDMEIPLGSRFAVPSDKSETTYVYTGIVEGGLKILECEQYGTIGNTYEGVVLPLVTVSNLIESKIIGTYQPANDTESDNELRERTKEIINRQSFGGNIADYIEKVKSLGGFGTCKVFPAWQHNGSVLLSVVDSNYDPITEESKQLIKNKLDPDEKTGTGVGIAPIGHYVTVTAPVKDEIKVSIQIDLPEGTLIGNVKEDIEKEIRSYFSKVRHQFKQDVNLAIYKSKIIDVVLNVPKIVNVRSVLLNDLDQDIKYTDEAKIGKQYLPYVKEVAIG